MFVQAPEQQRKDDSEHTSITLTSTYRTSLELNFQCIKYRRILCNSSLINNYNMKASREEAPSHAFIFVAQPVNMLVINALYILLKSLQIQNISNSQIGLGTCLKMLLKKYGRVFVGGMYVSEDEPERYRKIAVSDELDAHL